MICQPSEIIKFWFGNNPDDPFEHSPRWWKKSSDYDAQITQMFKETLDIADTPDIMAWKNDASAILAYILLTDQFPRNMYRDTGKMFGYDALALAATLDGIKTDVFRKFNTAEKQFFFMPLMHSEDIEIQEQSLKYYQHLVDTAPTNLKDTAEKIYDFALRHYDIIKMFGRYPHRNHLLHRPSTPEEQAFLQTEGSSF